MQFLQIVYAKVSLVQVLLIRKNIFLQNKNQRKTFVKVNALNFLARESLFFESILFIPVLVLCFFQSFGYPKLTLGHEGVRRVILSIFISLRTLMNPILVTYLILPLNIPGNLWFSDT